MRTTAEVLPLERRRGRRRDLVSGSHLLGAIMKRPWLQTAFSRLKVGMHENETSKSQNMIDGGSDSEASDCGLHFCENSAIFYSREGGLRLESASEIGRAHV